LHRPTRADAIQASGETRRRVASTRGSSPGDGGSAAEETLDEGAVEGLRDDPARSQG